MWKDKLTAGVGGNLWSSIKVNGARGGGNGGGGSLLFEALWEALRANSF